MPYEESKFLVDENGEAAGADFKMSDKQAMKKVVKMILPKANRKQRRAKAVELMGVLHGR